MRLVFCCCNLIYCVARWICYPSLEEAYISCASDAVCRLCVFPVVSECCRWRVVVVLRAGSSAAAYKALLAAAVRRSPNLTLRYLSGVYLHDIDDTLPEDVASANKQGTAAALSYYRAQARMRRRMAAIAVMHRAWRRSGGRPAAADSARSPVTRLAHMMQLRRMCRVRGEGELVEPFARSVVGYL